MDRATVSGHPTKSDVAGTPISVTTYEEVLALLDEPATDHEAQTYAFCNVHSVMTARKDPALAEMLRHFCIAAPDGMPLVWWLRASGHAMTDRVYGPDLMALALRYGVDQGWRHYFYGTTRSTLDALVNRITRVTPGVVVAGTLAPPFRGLSTEEQSAHLAAITASGATHVWIGLGMPRQERWVAANSAALSGHHVLAVGAAFDFLAGTVPQAPTWMQQRGLEWVYRLVHQPRRLARRYMVNNPAYLALFARHVLATKRGRGVA